MASSEADVVTEATEASEFDPQYRFSSGSGSESVRILCLRRTRQVTLSGVQDSGVIASVSAVEEGDGDIIDDGGAYVGVGDGIDCSRDDDVFGDVGDGSHDGTESVVRVSDDS